LISIIRTAEHVYDIGRVFELMHRVLRPGGLAVHCVPAFAFPNHGFYTPNPNLFVEFARANDYELIDFSYVDNMFVREKQMADNGIGDFSFDALPIQLTDMEETGRFMTKTVLQFHRNLMAPETRAALGGLAPELPADTTFPSEKFNLCFVFDLIFIAMQKPNQERPLVAPIQSMTGVAPLPQRGLKPEAPRGFAGRLIERVGRAFDR
jgi:SAM-dependent methyltransferase